jgi:hypothetical protein
LQTFKFKNSENCEEVYIAKRTSGDVGKSKYLGKTLTSNFHAGRD